MWQCFYEHKHPIIEFYYGVHKPVLRTHAVNAGEHWNAGGAAALVVDVPYQPVAAMGERGYEVEHTFLAHISLNAAHWSLQPMMNNPQLYGFLKINEAQAKVVKDFSHGRALAHPPKGRLRKYGRCLVANALFPRHTIHADLTGPITPTDVGGAKYVLFVVDVFSRYTFVVPLRSKTEVPDPLVFILTRIRAYLLDKGRIVQYLHTDQGTEFLTIK